MMLRKILALLVIGTMCLAGGAVPVQAALPPAEFTGALEAPAADTVCEHGYVEVRFSSPRAGGMDGVVETSENLELVGFTSAGISAQLSTDDHVVTIFGDPVAYVYRVCEQVGGSVSVALREAECTDGVGGLFAMCDEEWSAQVRTADDAASAPAAFSRSVAELMIGPEAAAVPAGGILEIAFLSPEGGGMDGEIRTSANLTLESMRSEDLSEQLSAPDHVVSLFADPVVYTYRVNAQPGEAVSVSLVNGKTSDAERRLSAMPTQEWTGVTGEANLPAARTPVPVRAPASSGSAAQDGAYMDAPDTAVTGRSIEVQFTSPADGGLEGYLETSSNLTFEGLRGGFMSAELSSERKAVSLFGEPLTYVYRVDAAAGEEVSVSLVRGQQSDGSCSMSPVEPEVWSCTVRSEDVAEEEPFVAVMAAPEVGDVRPGATIDVDFFGPVNGGMDGIVTASANLELEEVVSAGNGARLSSPDQVRSVLGVAVTYRFRVNGEPGDPVYVRLTDGRTADGETNESARVRNQIWMGVVAASASGLISAAPESDIVISAEGWLTGADAVQSVGDLRSQLTVPPETAMEILDRDGNVLADDARLATGQIVRLTENGREADRLTVVVAGDVIGSGTVGIAQLVRLAAACAGGSPLAGACERAADLNANGRVDIGDLAALAARLQSRR